MSKTRNLAAYVAWLVALVAILMPPALATAGLEAISQTGDAIFAIVDEPQATAVAMAATERSGRPA